MAENAEVTTVPVELPYQLDYRSLPSVSTVSILLENSDDEEEIGHEETAQDVAAPTAGMPEGVPEKAVKATEGTEVREGTVVTEGTEGLVEETADVMPTGEFQQVAVAGSLSQHSYTTGPQVVGFFVDI